MNGLAALAGLVVFSVVALYVYYPTPKDTFDEMSRVHADAWVAVRTGKKEEAVRQIHHLDLLTRKLQVGAFIRTGKMEPEAGKAAEDLRERLEELRDALLAGDTEGAKAMLSKVEEAYRKCRDAYLPPNSAGGTGSCPTASPVATAFNCVGHPLAQLVTPTPAAEGITAPASR